MKKCDKELTQKQMENVKGGASTVTPVFKDDPGGRRLTTTPHCRHCGKEVKPYGAWYRCAKAGCPECGIDKTAAEVDWK